MVIYLYQVVEPVTSRRLVLPVAVDDDGSHPRNVDVSFSSHTIGGTSGLRENDCIHYAIDYALPYSSIEANWLEPTSIYKWTYQGIRFTFSASGGEVKIISENPNSYYQKSEIHGIFLRVNSGGGLLTHFYYNYWHNGEYLPGASWEQEVDTWSIFGRWDGYNGDLIRGYWPGIYTDDIPELTEDQKNAIIDSVRRELDDRLRRTPPTSEVFRNAVNSIGNNMNSIANLLEGIDFVNDLLSFKVTDLVDDLRRINPKKIKDTLSSGWLGYRYSYSTTKSDIEGMTDYLLNYIDPNNFTNLKRYSSEGNEFGVTRCKVVFSSGDPINNTLRQLETTGMMLNAYAAWDMIPLSFVVDWFLPIGDFLEDLSGNWVSQPSVFNFGLIEFSVKTTLEDPARGIRAKAYKRWVSDGPPAFETYSSDPSTGTIVKRIFDGAALLIP